MMPNVLRARSGARRVLLALAAVAAPVLLAAAGGCGGASSSGGGSGASGGPGTGGEGGLGGPDLTALCKIAAQSECLETSTCRPKDFRYPSLDACIAATNALCSAESSFAALGFPGIGGGAAASIDVDWAAFIDCSEKKVALGPSCKPAPNVTAADVLAIRAACPASKIIHPGTRAAGAPCYLEFQCQAGLTCSTETSAGADGGFCGTCQPLAEGASCTGNNDCGIELGLECDTASKTCLRYAHAGEACDARLCDPNEFLACDRSTKKCAPLAQEGQSCASIDCDTPPFLFCSRADNTCKVTPRSPGDSCKPDAVCGAGLYCEAASFTCQPVVGEGAPCATAVCDPLLGLGCGGSPPTCMSPYAKVGEACGSAGAVMKPCWQSACVQPNPAAPGACVAYGVDGASCTTSDTCAETFSCVNGACQSEVSALFDADAAAYADALAGFSACL